MHRYIINRWSNGGGSRTTAPILCTVDADLFYKKIAELREKGLVKKGMNRLIRRQETTIFSYSDGMPAEHYWDIEMLDGAKIGAFE